MTTALDTALLEFDLADRLRRALRINNMSVGAMAEYLDVHRNSVTNWINGHTKTPGPVVKLWAMRTGVPYEWLRYGTQPDSPQGGIPQVTDGYLDNRIIKGPWVNYDSELSINAA